MKRGEIIGTERKMRRAALGLGGCALLVAIAFIARTEPVLGTLVRERLTRVALAKKVDLEVDTIRPHGLWGLSLIHVAARVPRPGTGRALEVWAPRIDVEPSLFSLLFGELVVERVVMRDATVSVTPFTGFREVAEPEVKVEVKPTPAVVKPRIERGSDARAAAPPGIFRNGLVLEGENLTVYYHADVSGSGPARIRRVEARLGQELAPESLSGYGIFPDGVKFALRSSPVERGLEVSMSADAHTWLDQWVDADVPVRLGLTGLTHCLGCSDKASVEVRNLRLGTVWNEDSMLRSPSATLVKDGDTVVISAVEMEFEAPETASLFSARIVQSRIVLDLDRAAMRGELEFADTSDGRLNLAWAWDNDLSVDLRARHFQTEEVWAAMGLPGRVRPGQVDGTTTIDWNRDLGLLELESALRFRDFEVGIRRVASEPLRFPRLQLNAHALVDIPGRSISISSGELGLGTQTLEFRGHLMDAGRGVKFSADLRAPVLDASTFRDELPTSLSRVAAGAELQGQFGFGLVVRGHSAFPRDLVLDGELHGDVRVSRDSAQFDIRSLTSAGPPPHLKRASLQNWRSYDQLPPILPQVLLSAEDAAFFGHPGFDWPGLQRAMIHNLESGALERGGSTISQQVVKNLFLEHDRTLARKLQEAYLTWRMESEVSKERILEIYLNIVEWGGGANGIARAARHYFGVDAVELTVPEVALLAAILPGPSRYGRPVKRGKLPSSRMHKIERILKNLRFLGQISMAEYNGWVEESRRGKVGRIQLQICDDDGSVEAARCSGG